MLAFILLVITVIFIIALGAKKVLSFKLCALCASISLSWATLLVLFYLGRFHDKVLLSLLMGQSITGIYYLVDKRILPALRIFALPFFLTLTTTVYLAIVGVRSIIPPLLVLLGLWIAAYIVFSYRRDPGKKLITDAVMNCCEDK